MINMKMNIEKFTIDINSSILSALKCIDNNKKSFVIVVDANLKVLSVLTDGDIRRALIKGYNVNDDLIKIVNSSFIYLTINDDLNKSIDIFKNTSVKFLPIIDDEKKLINVITRDQLHTLLLMDLKVDYNFDFESLDSCPIDYEIFNKPWGFYKTNVLNDFYQSKVLTVRPMQKLSLQSHKFRDEYWVVVHGNGIVIVGNEHINVSSGSFIKIEKNQLHRAINISNEENLIINEIQIGTYLGEDDIIRYEDDYGR